MVKAIKLQIDDMEQPQPHYRFRYATEGQSGAILTSVGSGKSARLFPQLKVLHYIGWVRVRCSCVTASGPPHRPHPFRLAGQNCVDGVFEVDKLITDSDRRIPLRNVGVQCVRLRDLRNPDMLRKCFEERMQRNVNPFNASWDQFDVKQDSHCVRLCFEVTAISASSGPPLQNVRPAQPIVTNVIHGKLTSDDLKIYRISARSAPATGNCELMILCSKIQANDIQISFYDERTKWNQVVEVRSSDVHKQYAMVTHVPRFHDVNIVKPTNIRIQLIRPSSGERSRPFNFQYLPVAANAQPTDATPSADNPYESRKRLRADVMMSSSTVADMEANSPSTSSSESTLNMFNSSDSSASPPSPKKQNVSKRKNNEQPEPDGISSSALMKSMIGKRLKSRIKAKDEDKHTQSKRKNHLSASVAGTESSSEPASTTDYYPNDVYNDVHVPDAGVGDPKEIASAYGTVSSDRSSHASSNRTQFSTIDYSDEAGSTSYVTTLSNSSVQSSTLGTALFIANSSDLESASMRYLLNDDSGISAPPVVSMLVVPTYLGFSNLLTSESLPAAAISGLMALSGSSTDTSTTTIASRVLNISHTPDPTVAADSLVRLETTPVAHSNVIAINMDATDVIIEKLPSVPSE